MKTSTQSRAFFFLRPLKMVFIYAKLKYLQVHKFELETECVYLFLFFLSRVQFQIAFFELNKN